MTALRSSSNIDPTMIAFGAEVFERVKPKLLALTKGVLGDVSLTHSVHRTRYGNAPQKGQAARGNPHAHPVAIVHDLWIEMTWNALSSNLQAGQNKRTHCIMLHNSNSSVTAYMSTFKNEDDFLKDMRGTIGNIVAEQEKRMAFVENGGRLGLEPVLAWHLADRGINADRFINAVANYSNGNVTIVDDINCAIKNNTIEGTLALSSEVRWAKGTLTITGLQLPAAQADSYVGQPVCGLIEHPALNHLAIKSIQTYTRKNASKSTVVLQTRPLAA